VRSIFTSGSVIERAGDRLVRAVHADRVDVGATSRAGRNALLDVQIFENSCARHAYRDLIRLRAAVPGREVRGAVGSDCAEAAELQQELCLMRK
jgi:hypothetical protein